MQLDTMEFRKLCLFLPLLFLIAQIEGRREGNTSQRDVAERRRDRDRDRDPIRENPRDRQRENDRREDQIATDSYRSYEMLSPPPPRYHSTKTPVMDRPIYSAEDADNLRIIANRANPNSIEPAMFHQQHKNHLNPPRHNIRDHMDESANMSGPEESRTEITLQDAGMRPPEPPKLLLPRINLRHDVPPGKAGKPSCNQCGGFTLGATGTCCTACGKLGYNKGCWCRSCDCLCYDT